MKYMISVPFLLNKMTNLSLFVVPYLVGTFPLNADDKTSIDSGTFYCSVLGFRGFPCERECAYFYERDDRQILNSRRKVEGRWMVFSLKRSFPLPEHRGIMIFHPWTGATSELPKDLAEKFFRLMSTDSYREIEKRVDLYDSVMWGFKQRGGLFSQKTEKFPVKACNSSYLLTIREDMPKFSDLEEYVWDFNKIYFESMEWIYGAVVESGLRPLYPLRDTFGISGELSLTSGRILMEHGNGYLSPSFYSLSALLQKEGVGNFSSCIAFNIKNAKTVYIILRYETLIQKQRFKDILISLDMSIGSEEPVKYYGVISDFIFDKDNPRAPMYAFDAVQKSFLYTDPVPVIK